MKDGGPTPYILWRRSGGNQVHDSASTWLSEGLDHGIRALVAQKTDAALSMDFGFQAIPSDFVPPFKEGEEVSSMANMPQDAEMCWILISAMRDIEPVWMATLLLGIFMMASSSVTTYRPLPNLGVTSMQIL